MYIFLLFTNFNYLKYRLTSYLTLLEQHPQLSPWTLFTLNNFAKLNTMNKSQIYKDKNQIGWDCKYYITLT